MNHILVTNDFPPKVGGIQSYLWELWRRLPSSETTIYTAAYAGSRDWDRSQPFRIERASSTHLVPSPALARTIERLGDEVGAQLVVIDPALPLGILAKWLDRPYGIVLHGAEVTVPGHLPGLRLLLGRILRGSSIVISAGGYPAAEGERAARCRLAIANIPPGVDVERFVPLPPAERDRARAAVGVRPDAELVVSVSRLVPRKGMDVLIEAAAQLRESRPHLVVLIGGEGRDRPRLEHLVARHRAPVRFLGRVSEGDLPSVYGCADLSVMLCRNRWLGLEQEGYGIVFLEAAACGVPQIAGRSGGSHEAVVDGVTGVVLDNPRSSEGAARAISRLLDDEGLRAAMAANARQRAASELTYGNLSARLAAALDAFEVGDR